MLLTTVVLVLREMLEAALIVSVLLAWSLLQGCRRRWIGAALAAGIAGAAVYARHAGAVSEWFDYVGMEVVNAGMQFTVCAVLLVLAARPAVRAATVWPMRVAVALAVVREGFEILLYLSGFVADRGAWSTVALGSALGAGIGISAGALLFYAVVGMRRARALRAAQLLIALFGGNMAAQGVLLLIQADWIPGGATLWSTAHLLAEDSVLGQLLYALVGYEATPSVWQATAYAAMFCLILWLFLRRPLHADGNDSGK